MNPQEIISRFRALLGAVNPGCAWISGRLVVKVNAGFRCQLLRDLEVAGFTPQFESEKACRIYEDLASDALPFECTINIKVPKLASKIAVVSSIDELLAMAAVQSGELAAYIIYDGKNVYSYAPGSGIAPTDELRNLSEVIELWNLLKSMSDHQQEDGTLVFFGVRKIEFGMGFSKADLGGKEIPWIIKFARDLDREEVRREIFKSMLAEIVVDQTPERAFSFLLQSLKLFSRRLREGLAVYLSDHSPVKLQKAAEEKALSYTEKIDKLVAGMEAKSLTIPAALLVAYKEAAPGEALLMGANLVVLVTTTLYLFTMIWAHLTQRGLVKQLECTVNSFSDELQKKGLGSDNPVLKSVCPNLKERIRYAGWATWIMCVCAGFPLLCIILQIEFGSAKPKPEDAKAPTINNAKA